LKLKPPKFLGLAARPPGWLKITLSVLPFILCIGVYLAASHIRHADNPRDKILPTPVQMADAMHRMAFEPDSNSGEYLLLNDTISSLTRLLTGITAAAFCGLILGMHMGLFRGFESLTAIFMTVVSIIPPLSLLPILFITFGVDEFAKITLIFLGTFPLITRDIYLYTKKIPYEQVTKALTLGASPLQTVYQVVMPQVIPRLIDTTRLCFGSAWLFLIAAEAIASTDGLGYRIFLVRRYLAMDIIIPYVMYISFIGYMTDFMLKSLLKRRYRWYLEQNS
jgi:NitT/TauT family transport system permease protein